MNTKSKLIQVSEECEIRNNIGLFKIRMFRIETKPDVINAIAALYIAPLIDGSLVRINSACLTSEAFGDQQCDCKWQLDEALRMIHKAGSGLVVYAPHHEGRGIGLFNKISTMYLSQTRDISSSTAFHALDFSSDERDYGFVEPILAWFELRKIALITNNPNKVSAQEQLNVSVVRRVPIISREPSLLRYLNAKRDELGHFINGLDYEQTGV